MSDKGVNDMNKEAGKRAMEYAQQMAWLISLKKNEYCEPGNSEGLDISL